MRRRTLHTLPRTVQSGQRRCLPMPKLIVVPLICVATLFAASAGKRPAFKDFPVEEIFHGKPVAPILVTKKQKLYRTMIREGARSKVEFAGHYTVPAWGCGSGCSEFAIVDSITGKVYDCPYVGDYPYQMIDRLQYHPNSRLFKINGCPNESDCGFYDYEMVEGKGLHLLRKQLLPPKNR